jgi:hypothetical protein
MAKAIEFYMPQNFRRPLRTVAQPQLGKIIEFCPQTKRSALLLSTFCGLRRNVTLIPTGTGFVHLEDSAPRLEPQRVSKALQV